MDQNNVAIIGSGMVGKCWAVVFSRAGYNVALYDSQSEILPAALSIISKMNQELLEIGLLGECKTASEATSRIRTVSTLEEALSNVFYVQECTPENVESKKQVFEQLERYASPDCILASSSSAIPPSAFTSHLSTRSRCLVAHPVNPPHVIPLVEVVPAPFTDASITDRARQLMLKIGQSPIIVNREIDSFVLNRLQGAVLNEAFELVRQKVVSVEDLDRTFRDGLGLRWAFMGPFETIDLNAPGGVADYAQRYGDNFFRLAQQQPEPERWSPSLIEDITKQRRELLSLDQLTERSQWRDRRLMHLVAHKKELDKKEKKE
eukprot:TRINITY_DN259_c0_g1_i1.p1 TRINITY_DN259_c0_g1~~TRINITY_DN259_c0_g1_i1.p1  ORF type:complete len:320 (-),score=71.05 TRINITY_DN259_c0_g1_i1:104-1063(-)